MSCFDFLGCKLATREQVPGVIPNGLQLPWCSVTFVPAYQSLLVQNEPQLLWEPFGLTQNQWKPQSSPKIIFRCIHHSYPKTVTSSAPTLFHLNPVFSLPPSSQWPQRSSQASLEDLGSSASLCVLTVMDRTHLLNIYSQILYKSSGQEIGFFILK